MDRWSQLLSDKRFSAICGRKKEIFSDVECPSFAKDDTRLEQERDHDRILFSTPFRRMGDKTQVFPLESIESIRTRLTHSCEVANLARSLGHSLAEMADLNLPDGFARKIPAVLAAAGLAHDIGNPPFGHQGENAIRAWFQRNAKALFVPPETSSGCDITKDIWSLTEQHRNDFLKFEGNAQTLRVLTKLQVIGDDLGLNLTVGTLAAVMKYVAASDELDKNTCARSKVGFFASEQRQVQKIREIVGLQGAARHPLALVMEACDDIAYSVLDTEDAIKKGLVSLNDLLAALEGGEKDEVINYICPLSRWEYNKLREQGLNPGELQDVSMQKFRVAAIHLMVSAVKDAFVKNYDAIMNGSFDKDLIGVSEATNLCTALKQFGRKNAYCHKTVLEIELNGYNTINRLMDFLWIGISEREVYGDPGSRRRSPFAAYVYSRISENYRRIFEGTVKTCHEPDDLPIRYREMQLLTDMVSGMTDRFCIELHEDFENHYREMRPIYGTCS